jgi:LysR family transcriptional activator of glutamate synthase operon
MELLQLRYFYESAKTESFAKTAQKYMIPTSSVSASIKRLESELGVKLFDRSCNKISLNANGKKFQQSVCAIFGELDSAVQNITSQPTDDREIKILVRATRQKITESIINYNSNHPNIKFKTVFDFSENDFEKYDIIIDEKADVYSDFDNFELSTLQIRLKASVKSPLCNKKLTLKQLSTQPFISWGEQSNMHKLLLRACNNVGFTPNIIVHSNDIECNERLIGSGIGIGLGSNTTKNTTFLDISDFDERYTVYCYYKGQSNYGNVEHFLNFLKTK